VETAAAANFITGYSENDYLLLHSNRRADAVILDALIDQRPAE
jgi:alpha-2-macroglobulin